MGFTLNSNSLAGLQGVYDGGTPAQKAAFRSSVSGGDGKLRVVIRGSSGASGAGSSGYVGDPDPGDGYPVSATSWAGMLAADIATLGGQSWNTSHSGTGSQHVLDNFYRDIGQYGPTHVLLATSPNNDNFVNAIGTGHDTYVANMLRAAEMCVQIGAIPILGAGIYPNNLWNQNHVTAARSMLHIFEQAGHRTVNVLDTVLDQTTGAIVSGLATDGAHMQDPGQLQMYAAFPADIWTATLPIQSRVLYGDTLTLGSADATFAPIRINVRRPMRSWTVAARIHTATTVATSRVVMAIEDVAGQGSPLRVRTAGNVFDLTDSTGASIIASTVPTNVAATRWVVVRHEFATGKTALFVDGIKVGEVTNSTFKTTPMNIVSIHGRTGSGGSNMQNGGVSAALIARRPMPDAEIAALSRGLLPPGRMECLMHDLRGPVYGRIQSAGTPAQIFGAYTASA